MNIRVKQVALLGALIGAVLYAKEAEPSILPFISEALWGATVGAATAVAVIFLTPVMLILLTFLFSLLLLAILVPAGVTRRAYELLVSFIWGEK